MKKRTGAHSAMAELLSKSNETQIKDPRITQRQSAASNAAPDAAMRKQAPSATPQITEKNNAGAKGHAPQNIRKHPAQNAGIRSSGQRTVAEKNATAPISVPSNRMAGGGKMPNSQRTAIPSVPRQVRQAPREKNSAPARKKRKDPIRSLIALAAVAAVAVICVVAVNVIVSLSDNQVIIPDVYGGNSSVTVSSSARKIELAAKTEDADRHLVTVEVFEGEAVVCSTVSTTVGDVIESMDVEVSADHVLRENEDDVIEADSVINYDKITYGTVTETASVPYETTYVDVQTIPKGSTKTVRNGSDGVSTATYKLTYVNGVETERVLESQVITTQPTNRIVNRGVGGTVTVGGKTYNYSYYIDCKTTVYTGGGTTASGLPASESVIAVDPRVIPLGTQVYVADPYCYVGIRTAADTGGSIKGNFIDIYFDEDNPSLWGYGVRSARVYILE